MSAAYLPPTGRVAHLTGSCSGATNADPRNRLAKPSPSSFSFLSCQPNHNGRPSCPSAVAPRPSGERLRDRQRRRPKGPSRRVCPAPFARTGRHRLCIDILRAGTRPLRSTGRSRSRAWGSSATTLRRGMLHTCQSTTPRASSCTTESRTRLSCGRRDSLSSTLKLSLLALTRSVAFLEKQRFWRRSAKYGGPTSSFAALMLCV